MGASSAAQNKVAFFRANYDGSAWHIYSALTGTTSAAAPDDAGYTLTGLIEEGKYDFQDDGTLKVSWTQYNDDETYYGFLDAINPVTATTTASRSDVVMEDGQKLTSGTTSGDYVLMIAYTTVANSKVKTIIAIGNIVKTSGSFGTKNSDWTAPTLEFQSTAIQADLSVPAAIFDLYNASTNTDGVLAANAVTAAETIPTKGSYLRKYYAKKS